MTTRAALKNNAKQRIRENLTPVLTVSALLAAVNFLLDLGGDALEILRLFLNGVLMIPFCYFILRLLRTGTARTEDFFGSFSNAIRWMLAGLWQNLWIFLWSLLLVIPGIVKSISYSQYFFILADNPEADLRQALKTSIRMTDGHKADLFLLALSFFN